MRPICRGMGGKLTTVIAALMLAATGSRADIAGHEKLLPIESDLMRAGWSEFMLPGKKANRYAGSDDGLISVSADDSVSFLYYDISEKSVDARFLRWRWRVDQAPPVSDLARVGQDDRPLAVHVVFREPDEGPFSFLEDLAAEAIGAPLSGKVLTYVWGGTGMRGDVIANPYMEDDGMLIVLRPGDAPKRRWFMEEIDFHADFARLFGYAPPPPAYIAISGDSDDTMSRISAKLADLTLVVRLRHSDPGMPGRPTR